MQLESTVRGDALERGRDSGIICGSGGESLLSQPPLGRNGELSAARGHLLGNWVVIRGRGDDRNILKILCGGADHRWPADVHVLDQLFKMHTGFGCGLLEIIKIYYHHIDRLYAMLGNRGAVRVVLAPVQDAAVHFGVQRLHPSIKHFGETGELGNVLDRDTRFAQQLGGATGRNQFHAHASELAGKVHQPRLIGDTENGTLNPGHSTPRTGRMMCLAEGSKKFYQ